MTIKLPKCHDCGAEPGDTHRGSCDVERCSVCGGQRMCCDEEGHDANFARWTGIWPGSAELAFLKQEGLLPPSANLNDIYTTKVNGMPLYQLLFVKPTKENEREV